MEGAVSVIGMLCRTADRLEGGSAGTQLLATELAARAGVEPRLVGRAGDGFRLGTWEDDLRDARGCLIEAGGQVEDALRRGERPVLVAADCSVSLTTLPAATRLVPDATFLWLDAHADFNTPETSPSQYLGGMCLAGACGVWDPGLDQPLVDPAAVVMCGVRDVDGGEQVLLETRGVARIPGVGALAAALEGRTVFVHLDLDVLDPAILPMPFPVAGGLSDAGLRTLLADVARSCDVVGCEVTSFAAPEQVELVASVLDPLL